MPCCAVPPCGQHAFDSDCTLYRDYFLYFYFSLTHSLFAIALQPLSAPESPVFAGFAITTLQILPYSMRAESPFVGRVWVLCTTYTCTVSYFLFLPLFLIPSSGFVLNSEGSNLSVLLLTPSLNVQCVWVPDCTGISWPSCARFKRNPLRSVGATHMCQPAGLSSHQLAVEYDVMCTTM
ncbi:hypothetical protein EDD17DRAFT_111358 [Pisolithus thermaeus]|nr:hypothetical protein EV401DRAFT_1242519 [Pisolithus croceorrhizus]KAI6165958.1 hypothetical protein EDD17DRAFT_111358 [Pisolithus thermaeus]